MSGMPVVGWSEAVRVWTRVGLLSFGGPAGQIAVMHRILVEEKAWVGEDRFLHALNFCMLLPGPEAQQLATYLGWMLNGVRGGLIAGLLFILPGFLSILALSLAYAALLGTPALNAVFFGIQAAVLAVILQALIKLGKRALKARWMLGVALVAFAAIFVFNLPYPLIVVAAAMAGLLLARPAGEAAEAARSAEQAETRPSARAAAVGLAGGAVIWLAPIGLLFALAGPDHVFVQLGSFFAQLSVVTFGGAYAVLAYMAQEAVATHGWLSAAEMLDGLGLAETTPGPLIQVVQFVGFLAGFREPSGLTPWLGAILASVLVTWVTFVPSFVLVLTGAPWMEGLRRAALLNKALSGITAAVFGVVLNLTVWFALHVLFARLEPLDVPGLALDIPVLVSLRLDALVLALAAGVALFRFRIGMIPVLLATAVAGTTWRLLAG